MKHGKNDETQRGGFSVANTILFGLLSVGLLAALAMASWYGWKYASDIDGTVAVGQVKITYDGNEILDLNVDGDMNASVNYVGIMLKGRLVFEGADPDSLLFRLQYVTYDDGTQNPNAVLYIRMPRSGVQGDFVGPWMVYYAWSPHDVGHSDWAFMQDDGKAFIGSGDDINAVSEQRDVLMSQSAEWKWKKEGSVLAAVPVSSL